MKSKPFEETIECKILVSVSQLLNSGVHNISGYKIARHSKLNESSVYKTLSKYATLEGQK